ncbi:hypothetical protein Q2941_29420 [Bradyrhizobium sp. UFLA05-153]
MPMLDHTLKADVTALEAITETGRRRWFKDDKAGASRRRCYQARSLSRLPRRHGLTTQQVFTWRRQARQLPTPMADDPPFVPALVDAVVPTVAVGQSRQPQKQALAPAHSFRRKLHRDAKIMSDDVALLDIQRQNRKRFR